MKITELKVCSLPVCVLLCGLWVCANPVNSNEEINAADVDLPIVSSSDQQFTPVVYFIEGLSDPRFPLVREYGPLLSDVKRVTQVDCPTSVCKNLRAKTVYQYDKHGRLVKKIYSPSNDGRERIWKYEYFSNDLPYPSAVTDESVAAEVVSRTRTEYKRDRSNNIVSDREVKTEGYFSKGKPDNNVISDRIREWGWHRKDNGYARTTERGDEWYYVNGLPKSRTNRRGDLDYQFSYSFYEDGKISDSTQSILRRDNTKLVIIRNNDVIGRPSNERRSTYVVNQNRLWKDRKTEWKYLEIDTRGNWTQRRRCLEKLSISKSGVETTEYDSCRWTRREIQYW